MNISSLTSQVYRRGYRTVPTKTNIKKTSNHKKDRLLNTNTNYKKPEPINKVSLVMKTDKACG